MAGVLDKLAQIREMDPAAEQKLRDELRRTPPASWPLVAEQFRASLAYHQQLSAKRPDRQQLIEPMSSFRRAPATSAENKARAVQSAEMAGHIAAASDRPSTAIGALVDPHDANVDYLPMYERSVENTTAGGLTSSPSDATPPAEFAGGGPMYPINERAGTASDQAAFQSPAFGTAHVATQALAKVESDRTRGQSPAHSARNQHSLPNQHEPPRSSAEKDWRQLVKKAADDLSRSASDSPTTTAEVHQHISLRLLRLLAGDTESALEPIPHTSPTEQDYWSRQIFALATYLDHHNQPDDKRRAAASVSHLDEAVSKLRELGSLSLRNLSFCKNVYGYGAFEPFEADKFAPGEQVSLYVEVENYHSTASDKGFCTLLGATYELVDDNGKRVTSGEFPDVEDCCRSRRRDFHIQLGFTLPKNMSPGRYRLELVVKDRQSDKLGHATAPFDIRMGRE
jgi:hypothetical protein